jgi:hypothetical protein
MIALLDEAFQAVASLSRKLETMVDMPSYFFQRLRRAFGLELSGTVERIMEIRVNASGRLSLTRRAAGISTRL